MVARRFIGVFCLMLMGCYETVPITAAAPRAGGEVEVRLTDRASNAMTQLVGDRVAAVRGHYAGASADTIRLNVLGVTRRDGREDFWKGEPLGIARADIATLSERKLSRPRTVGVVALAVVGATLVKLGLDGRTNTTGTRIPPPPTK
jgi:hypothetical protein